MGSVHRGKFHIKGSDSIDVANKWICPKQNVLDLKQLNTTDPARVPASPSSARLRKAFHRLAISAFFSGCHPVYPGVRSMFCCKPAGSRRNRTTGRVTPTWSKPQMHFAVALNCIELHCVVSQFAVFCAATA